MVVRLFSLRLGAWLAIATLLAAGARDAAGQASVVSIGDVSPAERPFIPGDQGIPTTGNTVFTTSVDFFGNPIDDFGLRFIDEDGEIVGQFNYERSANIEIGRYGTGQLLMSGGAALRVGDLIIGGDVAGSGDPFAAENSQSNDLDVRNGDFGDGSSTGSGTVEIAGDRTVYNNHPLIVETQYQLGTNPEATTFDIPTTYNPDFDLGGIDDFGGISDLIGPIARPGSVTVTGGGNGSSADGAFDLYVGLTGTGVLRITEGGRAEIRDGAFVGVAPGAVGRITVDGPRSYLGVYGMINPGSGTVEGSTGVSNTSRQETLIGLFGEGTLQISNGGRVDSFNRAALGAASGEGDNDDRSNTLAGGHGVAIVEGPGSVWRIFVEEGAGENDDEASGLSVGEFFNSAGALATRTNFLFTSSATGTGAPYEGNDGSGNLVIRNGGLVTIHTIELDDDDDDAAMRIGARGIVELAGGRLVVGDRIDNDGVIKTGYDAGLGDEQQGNGEIESGTFLNSAIGQVRVNAGERLLIRSTRDAGGLIAVPGKLFTAGTTMETYFYANAGKIEVLGDIAQGRAEIEFDRVNNNAEDRFKNFFAAAVPTGDPMVMATTNLRAQIKAQHATLYFRSGLENQADVDFVGGDNVVVGDVENTATGRIRILNESHVTFQDDLVNDGIVFLNNNSTFAVSGNFSGTGALIDVNPVGITIGGDYNYDGDLAFTIESVSGGFEHTSLNIVGDAIFGPNSTLAIGGTLTGVADGDSFELITVGGSLLDGGLTTIALPTAPAGLGFRPQVFDPLVDAQKYVLDVVSLVGIVGADFNGDGVVDIQDRLIWQQFNGLTSGATGATGDVDGDGDVDRDDGILLNQQLATGVPVPGAGSGAATTIPEPAAGVLLLLSAAALVGRSRRG